MSEEQVNAPKITGIFSEISFTIIESTKLPRDHFTKIIDALTQHGANYIPTNSEGRIENLRDVNIIVSATADFPEYEDALDSFIHVVKPSWVDQSIAKGKQTNPRQHSPDPALIMSDVIICCAGIPEGDAEAIAGGVIAMGGQYSESLSKMVTHLVTLDPDHEQAQLALAKNLKCEILLPHWFDDCLRLGRRLAENPYLFPDPSVLQPDWKGPPKSRRSEMIEGATSYSPTKYPAALVNPAQRRPLKVFENKKIMLGKDLELSFNRRSAIKEVITGSDGDLVDSVEQADIYICHYRDGPDYIKASQQGKIVANIAWLFYIITHDVWTSPMRRLMHYPVPRDGIPGFKDKLISITNYTGDARVYLQFLVQALGATFSKTMKQENTHLIVAHQGSEKCDAAREWNIEIVNHLWLEESYVNCQMQAITNPRYNHFPIRTNLGEVVGQTKLDRDIIERCYYPPEPEEPSRSKKKRVVDLRELDAVVSRAQEQVEELCALQEVDDNMDIDEPAPTKLQQAKRSKSDAAIRTPAPQRVSGLDKENDTPDTTGSRGAKDRAISKLHAAAADIALFNKEMKRVGGVTHGRSRRQSTEQMSESENAKEPSKSRKRKSEENEVDSSDDDGSRNMAGQVPIAGRKTKKVKSEKLPPIAHRMMVTFYERWHDKPESEPLDRNKLRNLGLHVVDDPTHVTILCAPKIVRTRKFVCALANAPHVVSTKFLDDCLKENRMPSIKKHAISDRESEERFVFNLLKALDRAKRNNHNFLKGWQIFCTEKIPGGFDTFNDIIKVNGGICTLYRGRTNMSVSKRSFDRFAADDPVAESQMDDNGDTLYLVSGSSKEETQLWPKFREQATRAGMTPVIAKSDWILSICMNQEFRWDDAWKLD